MTAYGPRHLSLGVGVQAAMPACVLPLFVGDNSTGSLTATPSTEQPVPSTCPIYFFLNSSFASFSPLAIDFTWTLSISFATYACAGVELASSATAFQ